MAASGRAVEFPLAHDVEVETRSYFRKSTSEERLLKADERFDELFRTIPQEIALLEGLTADDKRTLEQQSLMTLKQVFWVVEKKLKYWATMRARYIIAITLLQQEGIISVIVRQKEKSEDGTVVKLLKTIVSVVSGDGASVGSEACRRLFSETVSEGHLDPIAHAFFEWMMVDTSRGREPLHLARGLILLHQHPHLSGYVSQSKLFQYDDPEAVMQGLLWLERHGQLNERSSYRLLAHAYPRTLIQAWNFLEEKKVPGTSELALTLFPYHAPSQVARGIFILNRVGLLSDVNKTQLLQSSSDAAALHTLFDTPRAEVLSLLENVELLVSPEIVLRVLQIEHRMALANVMRALATLSPSPLKAEGLQVLAHENLLSLSLAFDNLRRGGIFSHLLTVENARAVIRSRTPEVVAAQLVEEASISHHVAAAASAVSSAVAFGASLAASGVGVLASAAVSGAGFAASGAGMLAAAAASGASFAVSGVGVLASAAASGASTAAATGANAVRSAASIAASAVSDAASRLPLPPMTFFGARAALAAGAVTAAAPAAAAEEAVTAAAAPPAAAAAPAPAAAIAEEAVIVAPTPPAP